MTVGDLYRDLDELAPFHWAFPGDKVGLLIGGREQMASRVAFTLDPSLDAVRFALSQGCQALVAHHPIIWDPLKAIPFVGAVAEAVRGGLAVFGFHTNWDAAPGGINDALAKRLALTNVVPIGQSFPIERLKVSFHCPKEHAEAILSAAAEAGAGTIGAYTHCSFRTSGKGTFFGSEGSNPSVGLPGRLEEVEEVKIEMVLPRARRDEVAQAIRQAHPYEEPAFDFCLIEGLRTPPIARLGVLPSPSSLHDFAQRVEIALGLCPDVWGDANRSISRVAVCGGAASDEWRNAKASGADVLVTGEVKQNVALDALEEGFCLIQAGHHATEHPGMADLADVMARKGWDCRVFEPLPGKAARPWNPQGHRRSGGNS